MKLERCRGQSHPRKHLPHHLTVGTSRRIQTRDLLTAPTETLPSSFPSQTANVSAGGGHVSRSDARPRGRCRAGGCASSQRNANPAASPLHLRLYVALWGFGPHCEPDAVMGARCKGARGTEPGGTEQALTPAAGQVEGTSASGALQFHSYREFLDSRNSTWNLRALTEGKLSKTSL